MPNGTDFSPDFVEPSLLGALLADSSATEKADVLARLAQLVKKNRRGLQKHTGEFEAMYDEAGRRLPVEGLVMLAERVHQGEAGARELLYPWMDALRQALVVPSTEGRHHILDLLSVSEAWLALYHDLRIRLLRLATERQTAAGQIMRARPMAGNPDYAELSREHMAIYPKIRARLAE